MEDSVDTAECRFCGDTCVPLPFGPAVCGPCRAEHRDER